MATSRFAEPVNFTLRRNLRRLPLPLAPSPSMPLSADTGGSGQGWPSLGWLGCSCAARIQPCLLRFYTAAAAALTSCWSIGVVMLGDVMPNGDNRTESAKQSHHFDRVSPSRRLSSHPSPLRLVPAAALLAAGQRQAQRRHVSDYYSRRSSLVVKSGAATHHRCDHQWNNTSLRCQQNTQWLCRRWHIATVDAAWVLATIYETWHWSNTELWDSVAA